MKSNPFTCRRCHGTGTDDQEDTCLDCEGSGIVSVPTARADLGIRLAADVAEILARRDARQTGISRAAEYEAEIDLGPLPSNSLQALELALQDRGDTTAVRLVASSLSRLDERTRQHLVRALALPERSRHRRRPRAQP